MYATSIGLLIDGVQSADEAPEVKAATKEPQAVVRAEVKTEDRGLFAQLFRKTKEFIEDETTLSPFESASRELLKGHINDVLTTLNAREKKVLELRLSILLLVFMSLLQNFWSVSIFYHQVFTGL
jgi:DNA-directed RNA polymerase sigma subunit (sigma70/sigma32)